MQHESFMFECEAKAFIAGLRAAGDRDPVTIEHVREEPADPTPLYVYQVSYPERRSK